MRSTLYVQTLRASTVRIDWDSALGDEVGEPIGAQVAGGAEHQAADAAREDRTGSAFTPSQPMPQPPAWRKPSAARGEADFSSMERTVALLTS